MKNLTLEQLAIKSGNAKSNQTINKINLFVMDNFKKEDYIKYNQIAMDIIMKNQWN
jgi:hypothetical protein